jgi:hypothetical protein
MFVKSDVKRNMHTTGKVVQTLITFMLIRVTKKVTRKRTWRYIVC